MSLMQEINEMKMPQYSYEDAISHAQDVARKRNDDVLVLQRIGVEDADAYEVYMADAYMHWSFALRDMYEIVARVSGNGKVQELT